MEIYHKDLVPLLPDELLIFQLQDIIDVSKELSYKGYLSDPLLNKVTMFLADDLYSYYHIIQNEIMAHHLNIDIDEYQTIFINNLIKYAGRDSFRLLDYGRIFEGWHSTRLLQQQILKLERMYDCNMIELKDWFKIVNGVRNLSQLCNDTFESLFC